jgi:hypothetical protein
MATIKINPAKLPYRGEPTRDCGPKPWTIPDDVKVIKVESKAMQTAHEAWKKKQAVHNKRGGKKNNANKWTDEQIDKAIELYWQGVDYPEIAKAVGRTEPATRRMIFLVRKARGLKERKIPGRQGANKWQPEEDEILIRLWHEGKSAKEIAESFPDRTDRGVYWRIFYLRDLGRLHIENRKRRF